MFYVFMFKLFIFRALETLINFAYSGRISINVNNVQSLLIGASFLQLKWVRNACATFIKERYFLI